MYYGRALWYMHNTCITTTIIHVLLVAALLAPALLWLLLWLWLLLLALALALWLHGSGSVVVSMTKSKLSELKQEGADPLSCKKATGGLEGSAQSHKPDHDHVLACVRHVSGTYHACITHVSCQHYANTCIRHVSGMHHACITHVWGMYQACKMYQASY